MRHLLLCRTFPPMTGGIERYLSDLFRRAGLDVHILAPRAPGAPRFDADFPHPVTRYPFLRRWRQGKMPLVPMAAWAARLAARERPRVIYSDQVQSGAVGLPLARMTGASHVVFAYGLELSPRRLRRLKGLVFSRSAAVVAISRFTGEAVASVYRVPPERIVLVRPGVDTARFTPALDASTDRRRLGLDADDLLLLTVGRLDASQRYKGYDRLIRLVARLGAEFPRLRLLIVGDGDDRERLQSLARQDGVAARVTWLGHASDGQLPMLFRVTDLFVLASGSPDADPFHVEGFGLVFAEAAASGVPCVAYRAGGVGDAVEAGTTGLLTEPNEEAFAAAVRELLQEPDRRHRMGQAARRYAVDRLGWDHGVAAMRELAARLGTGRAPARRPPGVTP